MFEFVLLQGLAILIPVALVGSALSLGLRLVRAVERRGAEPGEMQALRERVARLEQDVERALRGGPPR